MPLRSEQLADYIADRLEFVTFLACCSALLALLTGMNGQQALAFTALNLPFGLALLLGLANWRAQNTPLRTAPATRAASPWPARWLAVGGNSSYALFLVHFSVLLLCNVLWVQLGLQGAGALAVVALGYWAASLAVALVFERWVERPLSGWVSAWFPAARALSTK